MFYPYYKNENHNKNFEKEIQKTQDKIFNKNKQNQNIRSQ